MLRLKECRERRHMSQKFVALSVGVSPPTVSMWESGRKEPTRENLVKLANLFGVTVDYLLDREGAEGNGATAAGLTQEEAALLQIFRQLTPSGRTIVMATAEATLRQADMREETATPSAM